MPAVPILMVLYYNDATEVRYNDGSRIEISPCGSTFTHHECPQEERHPVHGLKFIHQRTLFATSDYRQKVIQAIDFRNRFAQRPYICEGFLQQGDAVLLYSDLKEVAWPKTVDETKFEILPDGGIRILSADDYASLSLSSHSQDFTVCYLSKLSDDRKAPKLTKVSFDAATHDDEHTTEPVCTESEICEIDTEAVDSPRETGLPLEALTKHYESTPKDDATAREDLNRTPTDQCHIDPIYLKIATPKKKNLHEDDNPIVTPYGKTAVFRDYGLKNEGNSADISAISAVSSNENFGHELSETFKQSKNTESPQLESDKSGSSQEDETKKEITKPHTHDSCWSVKFHYVWRSRHMSCQEPPSIWQHALKLAKEIHSKHESGQITKGNLDHPQSSYLKVKELPRKCLHGNCLKAIVPEPLPLTCQAQHLHRWQKNIFLDLRKDAVDDFSSSKNGLMKILLIDGAIYRFLRMPSMKAIEIYPGNGSVIISQGITGQYFRHIFPKNDQIEEKTYSLKSFLPKQFGAGSPLAKIIQRGYRLLVQSTQDSQYYADEQICWKHQGNKIIAPPSKTLLEECVVPGYGRFSAYNDGHIRILFEDRTSLDMKSDFSYRLSATTKISGGATKVKPGVQSLFAGISCRLFLPNGQYILVETDRPGIYARYVDIAKEWVMWVNSKPDERRQFYHDIMQHTQKQMSVDKELMKINCLSYILENLTFKKPESFSYIQQNNTNCDSRSRGERQGPEGLECGEIQTTMNQNSTYPSGWKPKQPIGHGYDRIPAAGSRSAFQPYRGPQSGPSNSMFSRPNQSAVDGFISVKEALLLTSQTIQDIDNILDKRK